jgi:cell division protein FtsA
MKSIRKVTEEEFLWMESNSSQEVMCVERVFALDIGTRLVMGLVMGKNQEGYQIVASARTEHRQRAMYDGQIHDIEEVANAVERVVLELEEKTKERLQFVSVAAAGRALKTAVAGAQRCESTPVIWERDSLLALELEAIQQALCEIRAEEADTVYHCVGYSTVNTFLDGQHLSSLIGQRGKEAKVEIIATFLPRTVIDGLTGVISRLGLEMRDLTLEPIAAGQAAIPSDMRRMNLALVDVGAGTADIALTRNGSFFAYGMVPMAGDEITERICQQYLVDFQMGEKLKRSLGSKAKLTFKDFLGAETTVTREEVQDLIKPVVCELADKIAKEILKLNQGIPHAVILIGGGSLTPLLPECLSEILELPRNRVGIQIRERLKGIIGEKSLKGPEAITPIGIGMSTIEGHGLHYFSVKVNGTQVPIFELQLATVSDALLAAGIPPRFLIARPGPALTFEINGEMKIAKGGFGKAAQFFLNDREVSLDQKLQPGDEIKFSSAMDGEKARITLGEFIPFTTAKQIKVNGELIYFESKIYCNGIQVERESEALDGSKIIYRPNKTLLDLLIFLNIPSSKLREIKILVGGKPHTYPAEKEVRVNNQNLPLDYELKCGDEVDIKDSELRIKDLNLKPDPIVFYVNGREVIYPPKTLKITSRGKLVSENETIRDEMEIIVEGYEHMPMLSDILPYANIPQEVSLGSSLEIRKNNQPAQFTTLLHPGDRIEIGWKK